MTIQDINGNYYSAALNPDASWSVTTSSTQTFIEVLPDSWDGVQIVWEADPETVGIWRSSTEEGNYKFSMDGRAIIQFIYDQQGIRGYGLLTIWQWQTDFTYAKFYPSELDFNTFNDRIQDSLLEIGTLDCGLRRDYMAYKDTVFNTPIWQPDGLGGWIPYNNNVWILHQGLKLLYSANFISQANPTNVIFPTDEAAPVNLYGFNHGSRTDGRHWLPSLSPYNIVANNGTTTFIGNDILQNFLLTRNQTLSYEQTFWGDTESRPYRTENYLLKDAIPYGPGVFDMNINISATFNLAIEYDNFSIFNNLFIGFVLFEIDQYNYPQGISGFPAVGNMAYTNLIKCYLPNAGSPHIMGPSTSCVVGTNPPATNIIDTNSLFNVSVPVTISPDKCYVLGVILDDDLIGVSGFELNNILELSSLSIAFASKYDGGLSGVPIPAPMLNPSVFAGYRGYQMLETLVPFLSTTETDLSGFPVPIIPAPYTGRSDWLSNPASTADSDTKPYNVAFTSAYCIHNLEGQSYLSMSISQHYNFWKKKFGMGMSIENDLSGNPTVLRMEPYTYYFPDASDLANMIIDLGFNCTGLEIKNAGEQLGIGANLKTGYQQPDLNSDFGVDVFCGSCFWNTPVPQIPGTIDLETSDILTEQNAIEKLRAQQVNQPVGDSYNPASPSTDNQTIALYLQSTPAPFILPDPPFIYCQPIDPDNNLVAVIPYQVEQFDGVMNPAAQSNDPTASTAPYVANLYYPDTAINLKLAPGRVFHRYVGNYLHSQLAKMDTLNLIFRKQSVMQYNNVALGLSGITQKLSFLSQTITEMKDIQIGTLPNALFQPITVSITATYLINMWQVMDTRPNGFIRFFWRNDGIGFKEYRFYPRRVEYVTNQKATVFSGLLCVGFPV